jgi:hypothetical protein
MIKLLVLILLSGSSVFACRMLPLEKNVDKYVYDWIKATPEIYLAEAVSFNADEESVSFKVKEVIKGEKTETVTVAGTLGTKNTSDFGFHRKEVFWEGILEGRTTYNSRCRFKPEFEIGRTYLVITQEPFQAKSFELIRNKSDWWYFRVKEILQLKKYRKFVVRREKKEAAPVPAPVPLPVSVPTPVASDAAVAPAAPVAEPAKTESP